MTVLAETTKIASISGHRRITLGLILALFILRFCVTASRMLTNPSEWQVLPAFEIGTYLLVAIFLIWESHSLQEYHVNTLAIWMVILFKPLETIYQSVMTQFSSSMAFPMAFPSFPSLFIWVIALGLLVHFRSRLFQKEAVAPRDWKWVLIGGLAGLAAILITAYPFSFQIPPLNLPGGYSVSSVLVSSLASGLAMVPYQIGYAAVSEEPVFRGFLWGTLRKSGWRDGWIWLFQAGLFLLAHLYYINTMPISFWIIVPVGGLVLGWLAWRSRSIATSMAAHGVMNGLAHTMGYLVAILRL